MSTQTYCLEDLFREADLEPTDHRLAVARILAGGSGDTARALTAKDILDTLRAAESSINRVTCYRVLDKLTSAGLAECHEDGAGVRRYCLADRPGERGGHVHFLCTSCGEMHCLRETDQADDLSKALRELATRALDCEVGGVEIRLDGRCAACRP